MRLPLAVNLASRDGLLTKDAKIVNGLVESRGEGVPPVVRKRPGTESLGTVDTGVSQMLADFYGVNVVIDDTVSRGTLSAIVSSPTTSALSPAVADLLMSHAKTAEGAATPRLFFKNRTNGWTMTRAGTVSTVSYGSTMGSRTYNLVSLTRSSSTLTATTTDDTGLGVGDSVTIAGADQSDYNGAKTVVTVTEGSYTPARVIPITITRSGTTATATTVSGDHGLTTATAYTIAGANEAAYNGSFTITVTSSTTFTYTLTETGAVTRAWNSADKSANVTLSGSDLIASGNSATGGTARATVGKSSGKWYWEITITTKNTADSRLPSFGVATAAHNLSNGVGVGTTSWGYLSNGALWYNSTSYAGVSSLSAGDVVGVALNADFGYVYFYKNGVYMGALTGASGTVYPAVTVITSSDSVTANFGASAFSYSAPYGYSALESSTPESPASGSITVTDPAVTTPSTFTYTQASAQATTATGTITASTSGGTVSGVPYINGYFFVMDVNAGVYASASDDPTTWSALDTVTANAHPGRGVALAKVGAYLVALKEFSTEIFYDAKNPTGFPFSPVDGGASAIGCANGWSATTVGDSLFWIAQTRTQRGRSVYMMNGLEQRRISTPDVERVLNEDDLATVYALSLTMDGHPCYILTLVTSAVTLCYDLVSGMWTTLTFCTIGSSKAVSSITRSGNIATVTTSVAHTLNDGDPVKISGAGQNEYNGYFQAFVNSTTEFEIVVADTAVTPATGTVSSYPYTESYFPFMSSISFQGHDLLLHASNGGLYELNINGSQDNSAPISMLIRTQRMDGGDTHNKKLAVARVIGTTHANDVAALRWSDDDCATYSDYRPVDLSEDDPEIRRCGAFKRRTMELRHVGNSTPTFEALELETGG